MLIEMFLHAVVWLAFSAVQLFVGWIDVCDAAVITLAVWLVLCANLGWNGWWALATGLAAALIVFVIFKNRIGFWIVSPFFSAFWSWLIVRVILCNIFKEMSQIVFWVLTVAVFALEVRLHIYARDRAETNAAIAADEAAEKAARLDTGVHHYYFDEAAGQMLRYDEPTEGIANADNERIMTNRWLDPRDGNFHPLAEKPLDADDPAWVREAYRARAEAGNH